MKTASTKTIENPTTMMKFLNNLSIKYQVWGGFFVILSLMIIISVAATISLNSTREQALSISDEAQPAMVSALRLQSQINYSASLMGLYIINNSPEYADSYHASLKELQIRLDNYKQLTQHSDDEKLIDLTGQLSQLLTEYLKIQKTLDYLTQNFVENFPALKISNQNINPVYKESMQIFDAMIESELEEPASKSRRQLLIDINQIRHNWMSIVATFRTFLAAPNAARIDQVELYIDLHSKLENKLNASAELFTFEQEEGAERLKTNASLYFSFINQVFEIFKNNQWRKDSTLIRTQLGPLMGKISGLVNDIVNHQSNGVDAGNQQLIKKISNTSVVLITLSLIALIVGVLIALTSSRQVTTITKEIKNSLQRMSAGDFTIQLNENRVGEVGMISAIINNFATQLAAMVKEMQMATDRLQIASTEMSNVTRETSNNIQQQHQETEMVATAVEQMTATAQEIASNASSAADSARQANQQSQDGAYASAEALGGINHLVNDLNNASDVIQNLQAESENISVVLDVISSISAQTNLLALNAAIEAARAGEQGRGFAVVADEVRTLASRTQESTNQIKDLIDKLQTGSGDAVDAMGRAIKEVNINSEQVERVAEALGGIAGEINTINSMLAQMAAASEQQSSTAEEISRNVVSISQLAELTSRGTEHINSAETELRGVSENIGKIISNFKT
ncbi:MAG: methyl-accepting chemotaxis protein [Gammaproteobacteria bacterium]|nr:methyl-accepting chemotaxis protein [Gammaproteobacteria bacterium]